MDSSLECGPKKKIRRKLVKRKKVVDPVVRVANAVLGAEGKMMVFTGAGVSEESGVPTYRDPGGIWEMFDQKAVGHINGFLGNPLQCWRFEFELWKLLRTVKPNKAHYCVAEMERWGFVHGVVTQNVDGLHQLAGSENVHELHGNEMRGVCLRRTCKRTYTAVEIFKGLGWVDDGLNIIEENVPPCPGKGKHGKKRRGDSDSSGSDASNISSDVSDTSSESSVDYEEMLEHPSRVEAFKSAPKCPSCEGVLKPDAIYFGEALNNNVKKNCITLSNNSLCAMVIGSSCIVSPANKLPLIVKSKGGTIIEVNPNTTIMTPHSLLHLEGRAGEVLPIITVTVLTISSAQAAVLAILASALQPPPFESSEMDY
eukprot:TRINITY_DN23969_c0_g1_i2.p1 TRINITY_DN23969_c0_g1~~TRINITY_DN23969_c0_g1_i2.p1  ORF type:complete len:401 (+),score=82.86 TRINITY_DN23969_c0_g1_i2:99-1205(+)